ncbi:MAG: hypothetical protein WCK86_03020 [Planctomycetia bacterium]
MKKMLLILIHLPLLFVAVGCTQNDSRDFVDFKKTQPAGSVQKTVPQVSPEETQAKPSADGSAEAGGPAESGAAVAQQVATVPAAEPGTAVSAAVPESSGQNPTAESGAENVAAESPLKTAEPAAEAAEIGDPRTVTSTQSGLSGPADRPAVDNAVTAEPRAIQLLIPQKRFRRERPGTSLRVSYDDIDLLKVLNMEPVPPNAPEHFPQWLKELDGKTVRIRGFMYPTFVATGLTGFTLARDNGICCFVRQPKIYDIIAVVMADGETTDYIANRPFDVEGIFRIDPQADDKDLSRLYRIEQARVLN